MIIFSLYFLVLFIWAGPLVSSLLKKNFSILHPTVFFPIFLVISVTTSVSEKVFGWSGKFNEGSGLRYGTSIEDISFYYYPLLLVAISGVFYMAGVFIATNKERKKNIIIFSKRQLKSKYKLTFKSRLQLILACFFFLFLLTAPFFLLGQNTGNFWTTVIFQSIYYIPAFIYLYDKKNGVILFICTIPFAIFTGSKASIIVIMLIYIVVLNINKYKLFIKLKHVVYMLIFYSIASSIFMYIAIDKGEISDVGAILRIFHREYSFDMFSLLVNYKSELAPVNSSFSWIMLELKEVIPSFIASSLSIEKLRAGILVVEYFTPSEYEYFINQDGGHIPSMYRFFLFPLYYDFSIYGVIFGSLFFGIFYGYIYSYIYKVAIKTNSNYVILLLAPFAVNSHLIVNGVYGIAIITVVLTVIILMVIMWLFKKFLSQSS